MVVQSCLHWTWSETPKTGFLVTQLILFQYKKPSVIIDMEKSLQEEFKKMKASQDGDVDCTPS